MIFLQVEAISLFDSTIITRSISSEEKSNLTLFNKSSLKSSITFVFLHSFFLFQTSSLEIEYNIPPILL